MERLFLLAIIFCCLLEAPLPALSEPCDGPTSASPPFVQKQSPLPLLTFGGTQLLLPREQAVGKSVTTSLTSGDGKHPSRLDENRSAEVSRLSAQMLKVPQSDKLVRVVNRTAAMPSVQLATANFGTGDKLIAALANASEPSPPAQPFTSTLGKNAKFTTPLAMPKPAPQAAKVITANLDDNGKFTAVLASANPPAQATPLNPNETGKTGDKNEPQVTTADTGQIGWAQAMPLRATGQSPSQMQTTDGNALIAGGGAERTVPSPAGETIPPSSAVAAPKPAISHSVIKGLMHLMERTFSMPGYTAPQSPPLLRRAPPAPLDPVFPSSEFLGTNSQSPMGINENNYAQYPLEQYLWERCPILKENRIRLYGWLNPSLNASTSRNSNFPLSYIVAANQVHWDQVVLRAERTPDTVQQRHMDWGFRLTSLYGEDYRFTTAKGWISNQLLQKNALTGWDPCECFGVLYTPKLFGKKIFDGVEWRVGRYISCPDIEAQLAPDNYLFTHSLMFTVDTYTQTGIQSWIQLNRNWNVMFGFHGGADTAPWTNSSVPTGQCLIRWVSNNNKDSIYGGINDINGLPFQNAQNYTPPGSQGKDNLQQYNVNWTHVFNRRFHTVTEWYYLDTRNALRGGTVSNGPVRSFGGGGGPGVFLPGTSDAIGMVNYTLFRVTAKDYLCLRPLDILIDPRGWRTGFPNTYESWTIGWCHRFSDLLCMRPELRFERAYDNPAYNNGTKRNQFTFSCDLIQRF